MTPQEQLKSVLIDSLLDYSKIIYDTIKGNIEIYKEIFENDNRSPNQIFLDEYNITPEELSRRTGLEKEICYKFLSGHIPITPKIAYELRSFQSSHFWLEKQALYDVMTGNNNIKHLPDIPTWFKFEFGFKFISNNKVCLYLGEGGAPLYDTTQIKLDDQVVEEIQTFEIDQYKHGYIYYDDFSEIWILANLKELDCKERMKLQKYE